MVGQAIGRVTVGVALTGQHLDLKIEIPTDQEQLVLGLRNDLPQRRKLVFPVNDERKPIGLPDPPEILIWIKETRRYLCFRALVLAHTRSPLLCRLVKDGLATTLSGATNLSIVLTKLSAGLECLVIIY